MSILPTVGGDPLTGMGQTTSVADGFKIADAGPARRRHDAGNVRAENRQEFGFKPSRPCENSP
jgi:hypothetical protein